MNDIMPALYINITELCNMKCEYCPTYGENWEPTPELLPLDRLLEVIRTGIEAGITTVRISGGEPFLYPDRVFAILKTLNSMGVNDVIINTNGFNLTVVAEELSRYRFTKLKVSLDALDAALFKLITGSSRCEDVVSGILCARKLQLPTELNMVVLQRNSAEFWKLLEFCEANGLPLKLLDLVLYDTLVRNTLSPEQYWQAEYFDLSGLVPELRKRYGEPRVVHLSNNRGIPMLQFSASGGCTVTLKSAREGSTFASVCRSCNQFPCQEGLYHLSVSAAGNLTPCRLRRDLTRGTAGATDAEIRKSFEEILAYYDGGFFLTDTVKYVKLHIGAKK